MPNTPPLPTWHAGREPVGRFLAARVLRWPGNFRMIPAAANGQPAFAAYLRGHDGELLTAWINGIPAVEGIIFENVFANECRA